MSVFTRVLNVFRADAVAREIDEELRAHVDEAVANGRDPEEVRRSFGSPLRLRERSRDYRIATWLESLWMDVVFGARQLAKHKAVTAVAVLSLGLSMGACLATFQLADALLWRPLPVAHPERLYYLNYPAPTRGGLTGPQVVFDYPQYKAMRDAVAGQADLLALTSSLPAVVSIGGGEAERASRQFVSGRFFLSFALKPALGRLLDESDDQKPNAHPLAVLSYDYWTRRFGRDPRVLGQRVRNGPMQLRIVGVVERGFEGTEPGTPTDIYVPEMMYWQAIENPNFSVFRIWAHLKLGVEPEPLRQRLELTSRAVRAGRVNEWHLPPDDWKEFVQAPIQIASATAGVSELQNQYRFALRVLGGLVGLVLLIACVNVANLMAAWANARQREMALRVCTGAGQGRLIQMAAIESLLLAGSSALVAIVFAAWSAPLVVLRLRTLYVEHRLSVLHVDWHVMAFFGGLTLLVCGLVCLLPLRQISTLRPIAALRGGQARVQRPMAALIATQVAFSVMVYYLSATFVLTAERLTTQPLGFRSQGMLTVGVSTGQPQGYTGWRRVRETLSHLPGVDSAGLSMLALMHGGLMTQEVWLHGQRQSVPEPYWLSIAPGWLQTMGIRLLDGRDFWPGDGPKVGIVNQAFARRYFNGADPVGQSFEGRTASTTETIQIVGYVSDARYFDMRQEIRPVVYSPFAENGGEVFGTFLVHTNMADPMALAPTVRAVVGKETGLRLRDIQRQSDFVDQHTVRERLLALLAAYFALLAFLLGSLGLYGVISHSVSQRQREIGIRLALGARPAHIIGTIANRVVWMVAAGAVAGLAAAFSLYRYTKDLLYQVDRFDPLLLAVPLAMMALALLLAIVPPVIRALRVDPGPMLRVD